MTAYTINAGRHIPIQLLSLKIKIINPQNDTR